VTLRERVTSKGGTTYAALTTLDAREVKAMLAMQRMARLIKWLTQRKEYKPTKNLPA
jgi:pyrroline-5-carboxylate reductase